MRGRRHRKVIPRGKGENKEHCDRVIREVVDRWDEVMYGKTTNQKGEEKDEQ